MDTKINFQQLARRVAIKKHMSQRGAEAFLREFFDAIIQNVTADKSVKITGLGSFKLIEVLDRESVDVNTGERIIIPGHSKLSFTPDGSLKETINKPFADFQTVIINEGTNLEEMEKIPSDSELQENSSSEENIGEVEEYSDDEDFSEPELENTPEPESEDVPEQETEDIPEPEIGDAPESEPIPEPEPADTPKAESIPEPEPADTPEAESIPELEPADTPKAESIPEPEPADTPEAEPILEYVPEDPMPLASPKVRAMTAAEKWTLTLSVIILCIMSYCAGYYRVLGFPTNFWVTDKGSTGSMELADDSLLQWESTLDGQLENQSMEDSSSLLLKDTVPAVSEDTVPAVSIVKDEQVTPHEKTERSQEEAIRPTLVRGKKYRISGTRKIHVMRSGEYLTKIALDEYGEREFAKYIIAHNHFSDPNNIPVGMEILLPELVEVK